MLGLRPEDLPETLRLLGDIGSMEPDAIDKLDESITSLRRYIFDLRPPVWARPSHPSELSRLLKELAWH